MKITTYNLSSELCPASRAVEKLEGEHALSLLCGLMFDKTWLFMAPDLTTKINLPEKLTEIKEKIMKPSRYTGVALGVFLLPQLEVEKFEQLVERTAQEFLQGDMPRYPDVACVFGLRYLHSGNALLFTCNHSEYPQQKETLLDPAYNLNGILKKQDIVLQTYFNMPYSIGVSTVKMLEILELNSQDCHNQLIADTYAREILKEKTKLNQQVPSKAPPATIKSFKV